MINLDLRATDIYDLIMSNSSFKIKVASHLHRNPELESSHFLLLSNTNKDLCLILSNLTDDVSFMNKQIGKKPVHFYAYTYIKIFKFLHTALQ